MSKPKHPHVAIVDFGLGNLFSVAQACRVASIDGEVTADPRAVAEADAIIIPGVGGFPKAMTNLEKSGLSSVIRDKAAAGTPIMGICLGLQLIMESSQEFGYTRGLGLVAGDVAALPSLPGPNGRNLPVPHVGWRRVTAGSSGNGWDISPLQHTPVGTKFYFVHSFYVRPAKLTDCVALTAFGTLDIAVAVKSGSVFGCQFHPERSGEQGLNLYKAFGQIIAMRRSGDD